MSATSNDFSEQVILITGGSSGIGLASAQAFINAGAKRVYITGRSQARLTKAREILGDRAIPVEADVASISDLQTLHTKVAANGDKLDVLFANAGIAIHNQFGSTTDVEFATTFDTNVKGLFFTVQSLLPLMKPASAIVLNASIAASKGMPNLSLYNASKAAVRSFARSWANDLKDSLIRVNTISPGVTRTPIMENGLGMKEEDIAHFSAYLAGAAPAGRMGRPEEIAAAVLFLASKAASYVNGVELCADGGLIQV
ncbi:SDR family oxidoreductase [Undibacterium sp.]|uniref:SDR family oxidoreductase n=1 Tax=Undibacterium sp. TaxID=1914977 RepID=UPI002731B6B3|nr:SDR family oxidoreductase [Undibacterium sp.]MDP1978392.1 SDR family oxidoreductase [Undibacterium sp.]